MLGWLGFALATFSISWFDRLAPGTPYLVANLLGSSLIGVSSGAIEFSKYIFLGRYFIDSIGSSSGVLEALCGAGTGVSRI
jgi:hypothetical protein